MNEAEISQLTKYDPVTYVPRHAKGDARHTDCEQGVFIEYVHSHKTCAVLYCKSRTVQRTPIEFLTLG